MRITQSMILRNTMQQVYENRDSLNKIQNRIATQKKVEKPSDNPLAFSRSSRFRTAYNQNEQFLKNLADADSWTNTTSQALDQLHEYAVQAKSLAQQGADGQSSAEFRVALAKSARSILEEAVTLANGQYMGKAVFAGTATQNNQPFTLNDTTVTYTGNAEPINRLISENMPFVINVSGQQLMDTQFFSGMADLIVALESNDVAGIQEAMQALSDAGEQALTLSTSLASQQTTLRLVENRLTDTNLNLASYISDEEDIELEEELVRFKAEETAYQAALQSAAQVMNINIMKFMAI